MKIGDLVWLVREEGGGKTMTPARLHSVSAKRIKIRVDNFGISSFVFNRPESDKYPATEATNAAKRGNRVAYRLEPRA